MSSHITNQVRVQVIRYETEDTRSFELVSPDGKLLPKYSAGAHIDVRLAADMIRQYSLCGPSWDRSRYRIGVLRENPGTGGSAFMHRNVKVGDLLQISEPKQMFSLNALAERHLLIAGGIGITPLMSMAFSLEQAQLPYELHYCARTPQRTAFREEIENLVNHGELNFHIDGGDPVDGLDLVSTLQDYQEGTHLYYCGPPGLMNAAKSASEHWPPGTVHYEYFTLEGMDQARTFSEKDNSEFQVRIASSGNMYVVPPDMSIVEVLRENGFWIETSCEEGFCGTCLTRYLEGEPEHRDVVLDDEDHEEYVLICCARSKTPELVLDL